jgi:3',5'-cyclic AMP phosphodiesterase CpdA
MTSFKLAHFSDVHLGPLPRPRLAELWGKRLVGYASWHGQRRRAHLPAALERLVDDARAQGVDHTVVTGDLVNIGLPGEFAAAAEWLERLGPPARVTVVPGNHDAYVTGADGAWRSWARWMGATAPCGAPLLPFVKRAGPLALIGLSTAIPTPVGYAHGRLGESQLAALDALLAGLPAGAAIRVVLLHHPPVAGWSAPRKALKDDAPFRAILARHGAELVLCGHEHRLALGALDGPAGPIPVVGAPSASLSRDGRRRSGGYLVYGFARTAPGAARLTIEHRRPDRLTGRIVAALQSSFGAVTPPRRLLARAA